jgi:hypothetical protein
MNLGSMNLGSMNLGSMNLGSMNFGPRERIFVGLGTAPPPRLQATKATQMVTIFLWVICGPV